MKNILDRDYIVDRGGDIFKLGTPLLAHGGMQLQFWRLAFNREAWYKHGVYSG